jgi:DNA primase
MTGYVDFAELKDRVSIEKMLEILSVSLKRQGAQLRGCCPIHQGRDQRGFVVTPAKNAFYCFGGCGGGDIIKLVEKMRHCDAKEAAHFIAERTGAVPGTVPSSGARNGNSSPQPEQGRKGAFDPEKYAQSLDPAHEALAGLGLAPETLRAWRSGYSSGGVNRGKLALPIARRDGTIIAYVGRSIDNAPPVLSFPKEFNPAEHLFGADRVGVGEIAVVGDILDVLRASEHGVDNCVAFLTETIGIAQLEILIGLMHETGATAVQLS